MPWVPLQTHTPLWSIYRSAVAAVETQSAVTIAPLKAAQLLLKSGLLPLIEIGSMRGAAAMCCLATGVRAEALARAPRLEVFAAFFARHRHARFRA
jgi:hypothetical protein